jgi:site-specific DNA recombinase
MMANVLTPLMPGSDSSNLQSHGGTLLAAHAYTRYSSNLQCPRSIEDQLAQALRHANSLGADVPDDGHHRFKDEAVSGKVLGKKRPGWFALKRLIVDGHVRILVCDEFSRLFRNNREAMQMMELIKLHDIKVLASNIDTRRDDWEEKWLLNMLMSQGEVKNLARRINRTLEGVVARGTAAGKLPYGYARKVHYRADGIKDYTEILIHPEHSLIVKRIFAERRQGRTLGSIAEGLNGDGVQVSGAASLHHDNRGLFWGCSSVAHVLTRKLYMGILSHGQFSSSQPHLALVSAEDWQLVQKNSRGISRTGRGGGVHWASGVVACSCGWTMTVHLQHRCDRKRSQMALICGPCGQKAAAGILKRPPQTKVETLQAVIEGSMPLILTDEVLAHYRREIEKMGTQTNDEQITGAKRKLAAVDLAIRNYTATIGKFGAEGLEAMQNALALALNEKATARLEIKSLEESEEAFRATDVKAQLRCDPRRLIKRFFQGKVPPGELRAVLCRIFPKIVLENKRTYGAARRQSNGKCSRVFNANGTRIVQQDGMRGTYRIETDFLVTVDFGKLFAYESDTPALKLAQPVFRVRVIHPKANPKNLFDVQVVGHDVVSDVGNTNNLSRRSLMQHENARLERLGIKDEYEIDELEEELARA